MHIRGYFLALFLGSLAVCEAQDLETDQPNKPDDQTGDVDYEVIYDEPFAVNTLFIHFQPLYGEAFVTNVNVGYGLKADYYLKDKADFSATLRKAYGRQFFDLTRDQAVKNSDVDNKPEVFNYYELGGTYHIRDFEASAQTKVILYNDSLKGNKWAAKVPAWTVVPCKVRRVYGARLGAIFWNSTVDVSRVKGVTNADLVDSEGTPLPADVSPFTRIGSTALYAGGSMTWVKNVGVEFADYDDRVDDLLLTTYFDLLIAPSVKVDDIVYTTRDTNGNAVSTDSYSSSVIETHSIGMRAGVEGKFNRTWSWGYGGELGYRPSIKGASFYALVRISIPIYTAYANKNV